MIRTYFAIFLLLAASLAQPQPFQGVGVTDDQARGSGGGHEWQGPVGEVNLYSLAKQTRVPIVSWRCRGGMLVDFALVHNSQALVPSRGLGHKWRHSMDATLLVWPEQAGMAAAIVWGDHRVSKFAHTGSWTPTDGYRDQLSQVAANAYELETTDRLRIRFESAGPSLRLWPKTHRIAHVADRNGNLIFYSYQPNGLLDRITDPSGRSIVFSYSGGMLASVQFEVLPMQRTWTVVHNPGRQLVSVTTPLVTTPGGPQAYTTQFAYDLQQNVLSMVDASGANWQYEYLGDRISAARRPGNPFAQVTRFASPTALERDVTPPIGAPFRYTYDALGRVVRYRSGLGHLLTLSYTDPDYGYAPTAVVWPTGEVQTADYDLGGRTVRFRRTPGQDFEYLYDGFGRLTRAEAPPVTDAWGVPEPGRRTFEYFYDASSNLVEVRRTIAPFLWLSTTAVYDPFGQVQTVSDPAGTVWTYQYDPFGNLVSYRTPQSRGCDISYLDPDRTFGFTRPDAFLYLNGFLTVYEYDEIGRLVRRLPAPLGMHEYEYDAMSRLVRMSDPVGTTLFAYDPNGRLVSEASGPWFLTHQRAPDGLLTRTDEIGPGGLRTRQFDYDPMRRLRDVVDGAANTQYTYDASSRIVQARYPNGGRTQHTYAGGFLVSTRHLDTGGGLVLGLDYGYQEDGFLNRVLASDGSSTLYKDDMLGRVVREERAGPAGYVYDWAYDNSGNRVFESLNGQPTSRFYDADGKLVFVQPPFGPPTLLFWDPAGRLVLRDRGTVRHEFAYDADGRTMVAREWNGFAMQDVAQYQYDALDRLARRQTFTPFGVPVSSSEWYYSAIGPSGNTLLREMTFRNAQQEQRRDAWGHGLVSQTDGLTLQPFYALTDAFGSVRALLDQAGLGVFPPFVYDEFGRTVQAPPQGFTHQYRGSRGWWHDHDVSGINAGRHWYNPVEGVFQDGEPAPLPDPRLTDRQRPTELVPIELVSLSLTAMKPLPPLPPRPLFQDRVSDDPLDLDDLFRKPLDLGPPEPPPPFKPEPMGPPEPNPFDFQRQRRLAVKLPQKPRRKLGVASGWLQGGKDVGGSDR